MKEKVLALVNVSPRGNAAVIWSSFSADGRPARHLQTEVGVGMVGVQCRYRTTLLAAGSSSLSETPYVWPLGDLFYSRIEEVTASRSGTNAVTSAQRLSQLSHSLSARPPIPRRHQAVQEIHDLEISIVEERDLRFIIDANRG